MKNYIYVLMLIMLIQFGLACQDTYQINEDVIIADIIVQEGIGADCNITVYNTDGMYINNTAMNNYDNLYNISLGELPKDFYTSKIECIKSGVNYFGSCNFEVTNKENEEKMMGVNLSIIIAIIFFIMFGLITIYITRVFDIESEKLQFWIVFLSFGTAISQILIILIINYNNYVGADVTGLIKVNFVITSIIFFFIAMITLIFSILNIFSGENLGIKPKEKW